MSKVVRTSGTIIIFQSEKAMKAMFPDTVWCNITGVAAGEIWTWELLGVKGLNGPWRFNIVAFGGIRLSPFTPKSDQFQISPAASPENITSHSMENMTY